MKKYRLKESAIVGISVMVLLMLVGAVALFNNTSSPVDVYEPYYDYITKTGFGAEIPVVGEPKVESTDNILKPYKDDKVKVVKGYYNYKGVEEEQKNSIIYHEDTYLQNTAIAYGGIESFEVAAILDGTVISVREDQVLGTIVEIEHGNNVISVYQSVSEVKVKENDIIKQGDIIAHSGKSNLNKSLNSHLLFELIINGQIVNPEEYYNKKLSEI